MASAEAKERGHLVALKGALHAVEEHAALGAAQRRSAGHAIVIGLLGAGAELPEVVKRIDAQLAQRLLCQHGHRARQVNQGAVVAEDAVHRT